MVAVVVEEGIWNKVFMTYFKVLFWHLQAKI
jgi:hypothetical protein